MRLSEVRLDLRHSPLRDCWQKWAYDKVFHICRQSLKGECLKSSLTSEKCAHTENLHMLGLEVHVLFYFFTLLDAIYWFTHLVAYIQENPSYSWSLATLILPTNFIGTPPDTQAHLCAHGNKLCNWSLTRGGFSRSFQLLDHHFNILEKFTT